MTFMNPQDYQLSTPEGRARTWAHFRDCTARGEAAAREQQEQIIEAGPPVGSWVQLSPFLRGQITEIRCNGLELPMALVVSTIPTGKGGEVASRSEWVALKGLQQVDAQPAPPLLLPLPEEASELLLEAVEGPAGFPHPGLGVAKAASALPTGSAGDQPYR